MTARRTPEQLEADEQLTAAVLAVVRAYWDDDEDAPDHPKPEAVLHYVVAAHARSFRNVEDGTDSYSYLAMDGPDGKPEHESEGLVSRLWRRWVAQPG